MARTLAEEIALGLFEPSCGGVRHALARRDRRPACWWPSAPPQAGSVAGYGAAAKGNTFLNAVGDAARTLRYVVDGSVEKQGKFMPGSPVPMLAPAALARDPVDDVLILPWNLAGS